MKTFYIIIMVVGILLVFLPGTIVSEDAAAITRAIVGSSLFGSGLVAHAITKAFEKKPEQDRDQETK